jgi:hypothetical protein
MEEKYGLHEDIKSIVLKDGWEDILGAKGLALTVIKALRGKINRTDRGRCAKRGGFFGQISSMQEPPRLFILDF